MLNILVFDSLDFPEDIEANIIKFDDYSSDHYIDVVIVTTETLFDFEDNRKKLRNHNPFILSILDSEDDYDVFKNFGSDSWIMADGFKLLSELLKNYQKTILSRRKVYEFVSILEQIKIYNSVNIENIDLLKVFLSSATKEIEGNFAKNIELLKKIENDDNIESIKSEVTNITNSLKEYIEILQCEDRIFQTLDGINLVFKDIEDKISSLDIDPVEMDEIKKELVKFYTVQDQRNIVLNLEEDLESIEKVTLF